jgi:hypothetical protein
MAMCIVTDDCFDTKLRELFEVVRIDVRGRGIEGSLGFAGRRVTGVDTDAKRKRDDVRRTPRNARDVQGQ